MKDGENVDGVRPDAMDQDVVGVDDRLACVGDATGAVNVRLIRKTVGRVLDRIGDAKRGDGVSIRYIGRQVVQVLTRLGTPEDRQRHLRMARSMIARVSAIT